MYTLGANTYIVHARSSFVYTLRSTKSGISFLLGAAKSTSDPGYKRLEKPHIKKKYKFHEITL